MLGKYKSIVFGVRNGPGQLLEQAGNLVAVWHTGDPVLGYFGILAVLVEPFFPSVMPPGLIFRFNLVN